jgi:urease accessory protein
MVFAIFHGYAHASEMPISSSISLYFIGFSVSTLLLHLLGVASGKFLISFKLDKLVFKVVGSMLTIFGGVLLVF